jgi:hypothetical protein
MANNIQDLRQTLKAAKQDLWKRPNVVATGIGYKISNGKQTDQLALICSVSSKKAKKSLAQSELIPGEIQGIPTDVYPTGTIYAFQDPTGRFRPAKGGISIGHINITAGTLGCIVTKNNKKYILSNNHVLANSNDGDIGDAILQPGPYDGGGYPDDHIANLSEFIPIQFDSDSGDGGGGDSTCPIANSIAGVLNIFASAAGSATRLVAKKKVIAEAAENLVDCALAEPLNQDDVSAEILNIGTIAGINEGTLGMSVKKSGRTTGFTTGTIQQIDATVQVSYGTNKIATFVDQLVTGYMSAGGDSGSAVLDNDNKIVGLLYAGSNNSMIMNRIQNVFSALNVTVA